MPHPPLKKIYWLLQSNQTTSVILDFLTLLKTRMERLLEIVFIVPETSGEILPQIKSLSPKLFKVENRTAYKNHQAFQAKRHILGDNSFAQGLTFSDTLLLDDLGGGNLIQTTVKIPQDESVAAIILQIPTPLGSSEKEERIFHSAITWAAACNIPSIGYELLPLDTRWLLAASLPDGVITRTRESFDHLSQTLDHRNIWQLPNYEASLFTSVSTQFNVNGAKAAYHNRSSHQIQENKTVVYLPHNVAMTYEYQDLIRLIAPFGKNIHLMISYGKDQSRGAFSHQDMVKLICAKELSAFASYSFHDLNAPWEMMLADCLCACSACFQTDIAQNKGIPCLIYDPMLETRSTGFKLRFNTSQEFKTALKKIISRKKNQLELGSIFMKIAGGKPKSG